MKILSMEVGPLGANCYIVACSETGEAFVIDPGGEGKRILNEIQKIGADLRYIINTHGHGDHIGANQFLKQATQAQLICHKKEAAMLTDPHMNLSSLYGEGVVSPEADRLVSGGDRLTVGKLELTFIHTPGHTRGGMCIHCSNGLFTGDTLFQRSVGRSDFPGGSHTDLVTAIRNKLFPLPDDTVVYPGHGPKTTIGDEKRSNPFL